MKIWLPSNVKIDVNEIFNKVEDLWGSKDLMALIVYGSSLYEEYKTVTKEKKFLFFKWQTTDTERVYPNDIDVAAIYRDIDTVHTDYHGDGYQFSKYESDGYSSHWVDIQRWAELHLMCVSYDSLVRNKKDTNFQKVLRGKIIWGSLPRPMDTICK